MSARVRRPAVAGTFYPADAASLRRLVDTCLPDVAPFATRPTALVVPHAGLVYSGPFAGEAYACLRGHEDTIERVVLLGPAHRERFEGLAAPTHDAFATPLGELAIDEAARRRALAHDAVGLRDTAHAAEHSLEVQLPFLQRVLGGVPILPLLAGTVGEEAVADVLADLLTMPGTLIVISTDLSHFHDDATARERDGRTAAAIEAREGSGLDGWDACGVAGLRGMLALARRRGLAVDRLALGTSADTAGDTARVVGYGAWSLKETSGQTTAPA